MLPPTLNGSDHSPIQTGTGSAQPLTDVELFSAFEALIRRDPARRGLIDSEAHHAPLLMGHLAAAGDHLVRRGQTVWLITGFFIPSAEPPAAETDGPPGTALLAAALLACGLHPRILTDERCGGCVRAAARIYGLPETAVSVLPQNHAALESWITEALVLPESRSLSHVIAVERVGPSHTMQSQGRTQASTLAAHAAFAEAVPAEHRDRCHNMRGAIIDADTAPLHRVIERVAAERPGVRTIGIGDGGNELGLGAVSWVELRRRLPGDTAAILPCRIATDWTILTGVSNWGAQALAAAVLWRRGKTDLLIEWGADAEEQRLKQLVIDGPAVDGVTRLSAPTVDGLPFLTYIQPWEGLRRYCAANAAEPSPSHG